MSRIMRRDGDIRAAENSSVEGSISSPTLLPPLLGLKDVLAVLPARQQPVEAPVSRPTSERDPFGNTTVGSFVRSHSMTLELPASSQQDCADVTTVLGSFATSSVDSAQQSDSEIIKRDIQFLLLLRCIDPQVLRTMKVREVGVLARCTAELLENISNLLHAAQDALSEKRKIPTIGQRGDTTGSIPTEKYDIPYLQLTRCEQPLLAHLNRFAISAYDNLRPKFKPTDPKLLLELTQVDLRSIRVIVARLAVCLAQREIVATEHTTPAESHHTVLRENRDTMLAWYQANRSNLTSLSNNPETQNLAREIIRLSEKSLRNATTILKRGSWTYKVGAYINEQLTVAALVEKLNSLISPQAEAVVVATAMLGVSAVIEEMTDEA